MNKLAAIYARVSSDRQREDKTIASQTTSLREYAQVQDYTVPSEWVFEDEGCNAPQLGVATAILSRRIVLWAKICVPLTTRVARSGACMTRVVGLLWSHANAPIPPQGRPTLVSG